MGSAVSARPFLSQSRAVRVPMQHLPAAIDMRPVCLTVLTNNSASSGVIREPILFPVSKVVTFLAIEAIIHPTGKRGTPWILYPCPRERCRVVEIAAFPVRAHGRAGPGRVARKAPAR